MGASVHRPVPDLSVLKHIAVFSAMSDEKLQALRRFMQHRSFGRHAVILRPGETADGVYVLLTGRAKVVLEDGRGNRMTTLLIEPNEFFGEMGVLDEAPRSGGVQTLEPCDTLFVRKAAFLDCMDGNYAAAMVLLRVVLARLRVAERKMASLGFMDVYARVARLFVESAEEVDGEWIVDTGSEEIARTVAASREMVSRVVKKMKDDGLVRKERRKTVILDRLSMSAACPP
jgi:CRP/FNR family transcriptional regulator, cyclic AMP receptor protein